MNMTDNMLGSIGVCGRERILGIKRRDRRWGGARPMGHAVTSTHACMKVVPALRCRAGTICALTLALVSCVRAHMAPVRQSLVACVCDLWSCLHPRR